MYFPHTTEYTYCSPQMFVSADWCALSSQSLSETSELLHLCYYTNTKQGTSWHCCM